MTTENNKGLNIDVEGVIAGVRDKATRKKLMDIVHEYDAKKLSDEEFDNKINAIVSGGSC